MNNAPIGIFDSGFGGLTVARAVHERLPQESLIFFGDTARCPYGPRDLREVCGFVHQIGSWLSQHDVKLIIIACNTATAAGSPLPRWSSMCQSSAWSSREPRGCAHDAQSSCWRHRHAGHG